MANTVVIMPNEPLWLQAIGADATIPYSSTNDRWLMDAIWAGQGVLGGSHLLVTQRGAGANFSVDVQIGSGVVLGGDTTNQGKYLVRSNAITNVVTPAAPGSGTRVHRIIARIRDKQAIGSGTYDWTLELLEDTGTGTPTQPVSAITLALVSIATGQASVLNANITDSRTPAQDYMGAVPSCKVYGTSSSSLTSSVPNNADTQVTWLGALWNKGIDGPMWASGSPTILTVKTPGIYHVEAQNVWAVNTTGIRASKIEKGSAANANIIAVDERNPQTSDETMTRCSCDFAFIANDVILLDVFQNSGGALNLTNTIFGGTTVTNVQNWLSATFIQPL